MKDYDRIDISGDSGEVTIDLSAAKLTTINTMQRDLFWRITRIEMTPAVGRGNPTSTPEKLQIFSGLSVDAEFPLYQFQFGHGSMLVQYVQPPCQNLSVYRVRDDERIYEGIVRLHWERVSLEDGERVWGKPGG